MHTFHFKQNNFVKALKKQKNVYTTCMVLLVTEIFFLSSHGNLAIVYYSF